MEIDYDIFISFKNSDREGNQTEDRELAYRLYEFLKSKDLSVFFSEFTLQELGIDSWGDEIEKALRSSKIFVALGTKEEYFSSYWIQRERTTFLTLKRDDKSKAIYSYIAPPLVTQNLPDDIKGFECFEDAKPHEFERLYSFISNHLARYFHRLKDNEYIDDTTANPYKGLYSFAYEDRENYYGREDESKTIAKILKTTRLFTLLGASGSGKSSFVFAGILPHILEENVEVLSFRPLDDPFKSLASTFIPTLYPDKIDQVEQKDKLTQKLITSDVKLNNLVETFLQETKSTKLYLVIDQFEELFTLTKDQKSRNLFLDQLLGLIDSSVDVTLIISMRSDFLSHISYYEPFNQAFNTSPNHVLGLFGKEHLREVIEKPSQNLGVTFQYGLVEKIIDEVAKEAGQLPLLEFALHQLWIHRRGRTISFESLKDIKSISRSISLYADGVYEKHTEIESSIKRVFINLVTIGRGTEDTKKRAKLDEFKAKDRETITLLANERLIITDKDEIEIVHEALIREWKQLKEWVDEYRDFLQWQERVQIDRNFYEKNSQKENLLRDGKLFEAKDFLKSHHEYISDRDRGFIEKSIKSDKWERTKKRMIFGSIFLAISGLAIFGFWQKGVAEKQTVIAKKNERKSAILNKRLTNTVGNLLSFGLDITYGEKDNDLKIYQSIINDFRDSKDKKLITLIGYAYHNSGLAYHNKKEYNKAIEFYKKSIKEEPLNAQSHYNLGRVYFDKKEYDKAILFFKKSINLWRKKFWKKGLLFIGNCYQEKKEYKKAIKVYNEIVKKYPKDDTVYNNMGNAYNNRKEYDKAIEAYQKAVEINPKNDEAYNNMGISYYHKKEYNKALEAYQKTVEINPQYDMAYNNIGVVYYTLGKFDEVIKFYIKAININPNNSLPYTNLFELQLTQNQLFDQKLEKQYIELFQNKKETFIDYEMLKILQNITHNKKVNLEQWKQEYRGIGLDGWSFYELHKWVDGVEDEKIQTRLKEALGVFEAHK